MNAIRPPDPSIVGTTMTYMPIPSSDACRRLVHLAFRDAHTVLDLTYAAGCFWRDPLPPGLTVTSNNIDPSAATDLHCDFTATGLPDRSYDLVVYDPPHVADAGKDSIMGRRFGSVRGTAGLKRLVEDGAVEAWRVARVGILVKVADSCHGGELLRLSQWVTDAILMRPYVVLHTYRAVGLLDGKWRRTRVPRNNGATYLVFRKSGVKHLDFDALYERQERQPARAAATQAS